MPAALSVDKSLSLARQAAKKQDWLQAQQLYKSVLDRFPGNKKAAKAVAELRSVAPAALMKSAQQKQLEEDWDAAGLHLEAADYFAPNVPVIMLALAKVYIETDRPKLGLSLCDRLLAHQPQNVEALILRGHALHELDQGETARTALQAALKLAPTDPTAFRLLGMVEQSAGDLKEAQRQFELGLQSNPNDVSLLRYLSILKKNVSLDDPHMALMRQTLVKLGEQNPRSGIIHFALFDMLHKAKDHAAAYPHLKKGNDILAATYPFDFKSEAIAGTYAKALFPEPVPAFDDVADTRFIFVTGLPRTGTTLTERILARDERVQACGELTLLRAAVFEQFNVLKAQGKARPGPEHIAALRERLLKGFSELSDGRPIAVDKMPLNFRWIGFICAALPEARIVHMSRDPRAVAFSLYRQVFRGRGHDFIFTFDDIARFMVYHRDLMSHWRKVCGDRVFDLNYSDLVNDQLGSSKALADAVGLTWSDAWLSPEKADTHVRTASVAQVTEPVYTNSDEGWKTYEAQLQPMLTSLKSAGLI